MGEQFALEAAGHCHTLQQAARCSRRAEMMHPYLKRWLQWQLRKNLPGLAEVETDCFIKVKICRFYKKLLGQVFYVKISQCNVCQCPFFAANIKGVYTPSSATSLTIDDDTLDVGCKEWTLRYIFEHLCSDQQTDVNVVYSLFDGCT